MFLIVGNLCLVLHLGVLVFVTTPLMLFGVATVRPSDVPPQHPPSPHIM
jgi:hypothetical protein